MLAALFQMSVATAASQYQKYRQKMGERRVDLALAETSKRRNEIQKLIHMFQVLIQGLITEGNISDESNIYHDKREPGHLQKLDEEAKERKRACDVAENRIERAEKDFDLIKLGKLNKAVPHLKQEYENALKAAAAAHAPYRHEATLATGSDQEIAALRNAQKAEQAAAAKNAASTAEPATRRRLAEDDDCRTFREALRAVRG